MSQARLCSEFSEGGEWFIFGNYKRREISGRACETVRSERRMNGGYLLYMQKWASVMYELRELIRLDKFIILELLCVQ